MTLPSIMVAPNGARKTKSDHPKMPVNIEEVVQAAVEARAFGADGLHAHVRDDEEQHVLDVGLYRELLGECERKLPGFYIQITTEAVGKYSPAEQMKLVHDLKPKAVSACLREFLGGSELPGPQDEHIVRDFYHWAHESGIELQHILFDAREVSLLGSCIERRIIPQSNPKLLFVLGRYTKNMQSEPEDLIPFVEELDRCFQEETPDWALCAFGKKESDCLLKAFELGGKARIGFENNIFNRDGSIADNNAERVGELVHLVTAKGIRVRPH